MQRHCRSASLRSLIGRETALFSAFRAFVRVEVGIAHPASRTAARTTINPGRWVPGSPAVAAMSAVSSDFPGLLDFPAFEGVKRTHTHTARGQRRWVWQRASGFFVSGCCSGFLGRPGVNRAG
jgi:hypothetical protein